MASIAQSGRRGLQPVAMRCLVDESRPQSKRDLVRTLPSYEPPREHTSPFRRRSRPRLGTRPPHPAVMLSGYRSMRNVHAIANLGFDCCPDYQVFRLE
jgi:hypothetical protein